MVDLLLQNKVDDEVQGIGVFRVDALVDGRLLVQILDNKELRRVLDLLSKVLDKKHSVNEMMENVRPVQERRRLDQLFWVLDSLQSLNELLSLGRLDELAQELEVLQWW